MTAIAHRPSDTTDTDTMSLDGSYLNENEPFPVVKFNQDAGDATTSTADKPKKEAAKDGKITVFAELCGQVNEVKVEFVMKPTATFKKLMNRFASSGGFDLKLLRFHYDGERVGIEDTPQGLGMEEGDSLEVYMEQDGGN